MANTESLGGGAVAKILSPVDGAAVFNGSVTFSPSILLKRGGFESPAALIVEGSSSLSANEGGS